MWIIREYFVGRELDKNQSTFSYHLTPEILNSVRNKIQLSGR